MKIPLIICGARGRMGREVIAQAYGHHKFLLMAGTARAHDSRTDDDVIPIFDSLSTALADAKAAVVIDFSTKEAARNNLLAAAEFRAPIMLGVTGLDDDILAIAKDASLRIPVIVAPNTSLMANLMAAFCRLASKALAQFEASILDIHHHAKKDAPSGTALALAQAITTSHPNLDIEIRSMRKGTVAGEHTVYLFNEYDRLELTHRVADRRIFAEGALVAAQFLFGRGPGLYDMDDVLNLKLTIDK